MTVLTEYRSRYWQGGTNGGNGCQSDELFKDVCKMFCGKQCFIDFMEAFLYTEGIQLTAAHSGGRCSDLTQIAKLLFNNSFFATISWRCKKEEKKPQWQMVML